MLKINQPNLPPPEMHKRQQHREHLADMDGIGSGVAGMLHETGQPRQQARHGKAEHDAHDNANVLENFNGCKVRIQGRIKTPGFDDWKTRAMAASFMSAVTFILPIHGILEGKLQSHP